MITNFSNSQLPIYEEAIKEYNDKMGNKNLFIVLNRATDRYEFPVENSSTLHAIEREDLLEFWNIFDRIKNTPFPMTKERLEINLNTLENEYKTKKKELHSEYCVSNNPYKIGDTITDHASTIKIERMSWGFGGLGIKPPENIYYGPRLKKDGAPFKNGDQEQIWQSNIITNTNK